MGTAYQGTEDEIRALDCFIKLMRAAESVAERTNRHIGRAGLTLSQFGVLEALFHRGPLCQKDLGAKILKSSGNITLVIDNLEKRGLVRRERGTDDRRYITVFLTEAGHSLIADIFPRHVAAITKEMGVITPEEQRELERVCRILGLRKRCERSMP
jgi:MarR family 2-MHQ and catechol resistance regulon transcriptional repressor